MNKIVLISLLVVSTLCVSSPSHAFIDNRTAFTMGWVGPHLNLIFGNKGVEVSLGVEASLWILGPNLPEDMTFFGGDVGIEYNFSRQIGVGYAELQVSALTWEVIPVSVGAGVGVVGDGEYGVGLQASFWGNYIGGGMLRLRQFGDVEYSREGSIGVYVKAPYMGFTRSVREEENPPQETSSEPVFDYGFFGAENGDADVTQGIR